MKKLFVLAMFVMAMVINGYSQFSFGVAPGIGTNSAYFGYKAEKVVPYIGIQSLMGTFKRDYTDRIIGGSLIDDSSIKGSGRLIIPEVGVKYFFNETGDLKAYFNLSVNKPIIGAKAEQNEVEIEEISEISDKIKLFGAEFGFGTEYFLSNNFSIGGELALRYFGGSFTNKYEYETGGQDAIETTKYSVGVMPTIAKFSLNFYFGGNSSK